MYCVNTTLNRLVVGGSSDLAGTVEMAVAGGGSTDMGPAGHMASLHDMAVSTLHDMAMSSGAGSNASLMLTVAYSGHA